jgi:hypothetical protein
VRRGEVTKRATLCALRWRDAATKHNPGLIPLVRAENFAKIFGETPPLASVARPSRFSSPCGRDSARHERNRAFSKKILYGKIRSMIIPLFVFADTCDEV